MIEHTPENREEKYAFYLGNLSDFLRQSTDAKGFADYLTKRQQQLIVRKPEPDVVNTWVAEIIALRKLLKDQRGDLGIALEATLAKTKARADVLLCGTNAEGKFCYDVIEAKGWHTARRDLHPRIAGVYDRRRYDVATYQNENSRVKELMLNLRRYTNTDDKSACSITSRISPDPRNQVWGYRQQLNRTLSVAYPENDCVIDASVLMYNQASVRKELRADLERDIHPEVLEAVPIYTRNRSGGSRSFRQLQRHLEEKYAGNNGGAYNHLFKALGGKV